MAITSKHEESLEPNDVLDKIEAEYASMAGSVFAAARARAIEAGHDLVEVEGDLLVRISPNGDREILKRIRPPRDVEPGVAYCLK
jgi:hypothetical protein